ncbi:MAG TPA: hypothetical protein VMT18_07365 [Planctomycetota bacterium]|nr:hypothetical protein [Planctomycetota bacterium]
MRRARRAALGGLVAALWCTCASALAHSQDDVLQRLNDALVRTRYGEALQLADELADPALAAEWRSYLHGVAGDLPGALREARVGLEQAPAHAALLTQALNASLSLGLADGAVELSGRLLAAVGDDPALAERAEALAGHARELESRERLAERSVARSRAVALAGLAAAVLAIALLARGAHEPMAAAD